MPKQTGPEYTSVLSYARARTVWFGALERDLHVADSPLFAGLKASIAAKCATRITDLQAANRMHEDRLIDTDPASAFKELDKVYTLALSAGVVSVAEFAEKGMETIIERHPQVFGSGELDIN